MASRGSPRMFAATTSPWYLPTWVKRPQPVDVADRPDASARAQVRVDRHSTRVRLDADACRGRARRTRGRRPVATSKPVTAQLAPVVESRARSRHRRGASDGCAEQASSMPSASSDRAERLAERRGSRPSRCSAISVTTTSPPSRRTTCPSSTPTGPPPRIKQAPREPPSSRSPRGCVQHAVDVRAAGIRAGTTGSAPLARTTWSCGMRARRRLRRPPAGRAAGCRGAGRCRDRRASAPVRRRSGRRP